MDVYPTVMIVDRSNIVRYVRVGADPKLGEELRRALDEILKAESGQGHSSPKTDGNRSFPVCNGEKATPAVILDGRLAAKQF